MRSSSAVDAVIEAWATTPQGRAAGRERKMTGFFYGCETAPCGVWSGPAGARFSGVVASRPC
jgi:hypothetical protein